MLDIGMYNICLKQGALYERSIVITDKDDNILIVDGFNAASMIFRSDSCTATPFLTLTLGSGLTLGTGVSFEGIYNNSTSYVIGNVVTFVFDCGEKGFFECTAPSTGNLPTDTNFWKIYSTILVEITGSQTAAITELSGIYDLKLTPTNVDDSFFRLEGNVSIKTSG